MKAQPFKSSDIKDEHYSKLANCENQKFWDIFSGKAAPSLDFKGTNLYYLDLIEKMLNPNPKERITINQMMKHPWTNGESMSRDEYRK